MERNDPGFDLNFEDRLVLSVNFDVCLDDNWTSLNVV
jgi:hypothetical protein